MVAIVVLEISGTTRPRIIDALAAATNSQTTQSYSATPTNSAPTLKLTYITNAPKNNSRTLDEGETLTLKVQAGDADHDYVSLNALGLPKGASWNFSNGNPATGTFTWKPPAGTAAKLPVVAISFTATDTPVNGTHSRTTTQSVILHIGQNTPPYITLQPEAVATVGKKLNIPVLVTDNDQDVLSVVHSRLPKGAKFSTKKQINGKLTGILLYKPVSSDAGQKITINFTAKDSYPNPYQVTQDITIYVNP